MTTEENPLQGFHFTLHQSDGDRDEVFVSEMLAQRLRGLLSPGCKRFVFQVERAPSTGRLHIQGQVDLKRQFRMRLSQLAKKFAAWGYPKNHLSATSGGDGFTYCLKSETRVAGPWADRPIQEMLDAEAKRLYEYQGEDLIQTYQGWQVKLDAYLAGPVNKREIIWLYDEGGCSGKSQFTKALAHRRKAAVFEWGDARHMKYEICEAGPKKIYLFDLSRTRPQEYSNNDLYAVLESLKNGLLVSGMYKSPKLFMEPPHVVVFANIAPDETKLTKDRWNIRRVSPEDHALFSNLRLAEQQVQFDM